MTEPRFEVGDRIVHAAYGPSGTVRGAADQGLRYYITWDHLVEKPTACENTSLIEGRDLRLISPLLQLADAADD